MDGSPAYPLIVSDQMNNLKQTVRIQTWSKPAAGASLTMLWRQCGATQGENCTGELRNIPGSALTTDLPPLEVRRRAFQQPQISGWATWHPHNYLSWVSLPDSSQISLIVCQLSVQDCLTVSYGPDDHTNTLRPGLHAIDRSYAEYCELKYKIRLFSFGILIETAEMMENSPWENDDFVFNNGRLFCNSRYSVNAFASPLGLNVSVRWSGGGDDLRVMVTPKGCVTKLSKSNCSDFAVVFATDFAWSRAGSTLARCQGDDCYLSLKPHGLKPHKLTAMLSGDKHRSILKAASECNVTGFTEVPKGTRPLPAPGTGLTIRLADMSSAVYLSTVTETWQQTVAALDKAEEAERASLSTHGDNADNVGAIRAAVMWNNIYLPAEQGPMLPVDRSWDLSKGPSSQDWRYTDFQWDNHFASLMMGLDNSSRARDLAICNLVQTIRSTKTAEGFGSNYGAAGSHSVDRTEPPQAARVLATLYDKYNASYSDAGGPGLDWVVELVFQDLLDW